jgi:hypothetical protein
MRQVAIKIMSTLLLAPAGFYLGCFAYRVATALLYYLATMSMILLHIFGFHPKVFQVLSFAFDKAREFDPAMYGAGFVALCIALIVLPKRLDSGTGRERPLAIVVAFLVLFSVAAFCDLSFGITPFGDFAARDRPYNASNRPVSKILSVEDIMYLPDKLSGSFVESEGILEYDQRMGRFSLRNPVERGHSIKLYLYRGSRTQFSEMRRNGKPRYFDKVEHLIGKRVKLLGICVNGQIDVNISDIKLVDQMQQIAPEQKETEQTSRTESQAPISN